MKAAQPMNGTIDPGVEKIAAAETMSPGEFFACAAEIRDAPTGRWAPPPVLKPSSPTLTAQ